MAYSDLELNQTVSFNNLQSGVTQGYFVAITTIPVSAKQITKTEADTYVNINTTLPSYADKASNQLVVRSNLQGETNVFPYTIYALVGYGGATTWTAWKSIDGGNNFNQLTGLSASAGWTVYPPLSALPMAKSGSGLGMTLWLVSMAIFIASSLLGSLNYIVTVINLRTKGMSMTRLPLTIWAFFVTAIIGVVSFPVLLSAALLLIMDRSFGTSFFLSDIFIQG